MKPLNWTEVIDMFSFRVKIYLYTASCVFQLLTSKLLHHSQQPMFLVIFLTIFKC